MNKARPHRREPIYTGPHPNSSRLRRANERGVEKYPNIFPTRLSPRTSFEQGTGYDPELLAQRAADELRHLVRSPRLDHVTSTIIELVSTRAERVWAAQPYWRKRWGRCASLGSAAPLMLFFRHWAHAAAVREGVPINTL